MPKKRIIKIIDKTAHPPVEVRRIEDRRAGTARRQSQRRASSKDRRAEWIAPKDARITWNEKAGCYHVQYKDGKIDKRKISNYLETDKGIVCFTDRRKGERRAGLEDRRGPEGLKPQYESAEALGKSINDIPMRKKLGGIDRELSKRRKRRQ